MNLTHKIFIGLIAVSLLSATPQAMAQQQKQKQGVPTLNANAKKYTEKKRESNKPVRPGQYTSSPKQEVLVGFRSTSSLLNKQTATVAPAPSMEFKNNPANSSATMEIFQTSSAQGPKTVNGSSWSGGNAAEGLMTSGSQYSSAATNGGGNTTVGAVSTPAGPRKVNGYPDIPFPDEPVPIGDVLWPLALMALAYCGFLICKKRKAQD
jgi:hypothetical protein